jgi:predicted DNA-binding transcriptional regulator YafY
VTVAIVYRNHRGETWTRRIIPQRIWYGRTEWHPEEQWMLDAYDLERAAMRSFAMQDIQVWEPDDSLLRWFQAGMSARSDKPDGEGA